MLLAIDAGNSRVKWAAWDGRRWGGHDAAAATGDLGRLRLAAAAARSCVACCVGPPATRAALDRVLHGQDVRWVTAAAAAHGVTNHYRPPESLGADRWCALLGLRERRGAGTAVLAGTATTVDSLAPDGTYAGGLVLPGRRLMHEALAAGTAMRLPDRAPGPTLPVPDHTAAAVTAGCLRAVAGAVAAHVTAVGDQAWPVLVAGGDAAAVVAQVAGAEPAPDLVLDGLRVAAG